MIRTFLILALFIMSILALAVVLEPLYKTLGHDEQQREG